LTAGTLTEKPYEKFLEGDAGYYISQPEEAAQKYFSGQDVEYG
jgi:hypothetical protein